MKLAKANKILREVVLERLPGCRTTNLQNVLDALCEVAIEGRIERYVFEPHLTRLRQYFVELESEQCLELAFEDRRGRRALASIKLRQREIPPAQVKEKNPGHASKKDARNLTQEEKFALLHGEGTSNKVATPPHCLVFVDVPNLTNHPNIMGEIGGRTARFLNFFRADWQELRKLVVKMTAVPLDAQDCYLYTQVMENVEHAFSDACRKIEDAGIHIEKRWRKDIDPILNTHMILKTIPYLHENREIHLVLASGDGDFAYALRGLCEIAQQLGAHLTVYVLTWSNKVAFDLRQVAHHLTHLEDYLSRIDPVGAEMLQEHSRQTA
jgi:uncharacterized LabA/DUF88 family protein